MALFAQGVLGYSGNCNGFSYAYDGGCTSAMFSGSLARSWVLDALRVCRFQWQGLRSLVASSHKSFVLAGRLRRDMKRDMTELHDDNLSIDICLFSIVPDIHLL
jgi:hypothetical protein